jgi:hypothetical protein
VPAGWPRGGRIVVLALAFAAFCLPGCRRRTPAAPGLDLSSFLPAAQDAVPWKPEGPAQEFKGEDLFLYIDGGAEIYREYGFDTVLVQDYRNPAGGTISLEIFKMTSPEGAFGMYTFKRGPKGEPVDLGAEGRLEAYYLNFWKGPYVVTLTGSADDAAVRPALVQLARSTAGKISGPSPRPALAASLPQAGLIADSLRYFRGFLGFMNVYPSLEKNAFAIEEGVRGDYASGAVLFVLQYPSDAEAEQCFRAVRAAVQDDPLAKDLESPGRLFFRALDERGRRLSLRASGERLLVGLEDEGHDDVSRLFEAVLKTH